jgi:hypothetical protein
MAGSRAADGAVGNSYTRSPFANTCSGTGTTTKTKTVFRNTYIYTYLGLHSGWNFSLRQNSSLNRVSGRKTACGLKSIFWGF